MRLVSTANIGFCDFLPSKNTNIDLLTPLLGTPRVRLSLAAAPLR